MITLQALLTGLLAAHSRRDGPVTRMDVTRREAADLAP